MRPRFSGARRPTPYPFCRFRLTQLNSARGKQCPFLIPPRVFVDDRTFRVVTPPVCSDSGGLMNRAGIFLALVLGLVFTLPRFTVGQQSESSAMAGFFDNSAQQEQDWEQKYKAIPSPQNM